MREEEENDRAYRNRHPGYDMQCAHVILLAWSSTLREKLRQWLRHMPTVQEEHEAHEARASPHS